jgi:WD40 repeat protein
LESGDCIRILNDHTGHVYSILKYSNDCFLSGSLDKTIKLWNVNSGECLRTFKCHLKTVICVEILSNERIISGSADNTIKI